ncbi:hypothetical protein PBI_MIMI_300 [Arthrobacter phage Mimi]|nr:hypothetical protein PBI_MIMI_94 [Arthrobacter phage Mimi]
MTSVGSCRIVVSTNPASPQEDTMSHILGEFDVQIDGNHRYEDSVTQIDVYPVYIDTLGKRSTDTTKTLASTEIPSEGYADDCWYDVPSAFDEIRKLPHHVVEATGMAIAVAMNLQMETAKKDHKYHIGDTVFLPEYKFPGDVRHLTVDGGYIIDMANTGELAEFSESELEDYDQELWHRP